MFIKFVDIDWLIFCVILTIACSLRACQMWLTRNHMFIRQVWGKFTSFIFEISKSPSFHLGGFIVSKSELGKFIRNFPLKRVITSTNSLYISRTPFLRTPLKGCFWTIVHLVIPTDTAMWKLIVQNFCKKTLRQKLIKEQSTEKDKKVLQNKYTERRSEPCKPRKQALTLTNITRVISGKVERSPW